MVTLELTPGTMLHNSSYRILRVLGQGGFGITYLALDVNLDKQVAIKEFFPKMLCGRSLDDSHVTVLTQINEELVEKLKSKFLKEARNIARLNHPNIIKIYAAFEQNDTAYYVMELIEGQSLMEYVRANGKLSTEVALDYIRKVGSALEYIHEKRINHLDVKPANILLRASDSQPVLIDFGLSKQYDDDGKQTSTTPTGVSHGYAPIEQYKPGGVSEFSPETDIYSLGATLYYMLTGTTPPDAYEVMSNGLEFPESFPERLKPAVRKAMSVAKPDRFRSIADFLADLQEKTPGKAPQPHGDETKIHHAENVITLIDEDSEKLDEEPEKRSKRIRLTIIIVAVIIVLLVIAGLVALYINSQDDYIYNDYPQDTTYVEQTEVEVVAVPATKWATDSCYAEWDSIVAN